MNRQPFAPGVIDTEQPRRRAHPALRCALAVLAWLAVVAAASCAAGVIVGRLP